MNAVRRVVAFPQAIECRSLLRAAPRGLSVLVTRQKPSSLTSTCNVDEIKHVLPSFPQGISARRDEGPAQIRRTSRSREVGEKPDLESASACLHSKICDVRMVYIRHIPDNCSFHPSTPHVRSYHTIHIVFQPALVTNTSGIRGRGVRVQRRLLCVSFPKYVEHPSAGDATFPHYIPLVWGS